MFERGRPLSTAERQLFQPYFQFHTLQKARIIEDRTLFWLRKNMCAVVLGHRIYFRAGAYQFNTVQGTELLAHELTHVEQYLSGMNIFKYLWAARNGYRKNPYEIEAYAKAADVRAKIQRVNNVMCNCKQV